MKRNERKLTRLILAALMCTGGHLVSSGVASAAETTDTGTHPAATIKKATIASGQFNGKEIYFLNDTATYDTLILGAPGADARMAAAYAPTGNLSGFHVKVIGGTAWKAVWGAFTENGIVSGNTVTVTDAGSLSCPVYGGYAQVGSAQNNTVKFSGGKAMLVMGGFAHTTNYADVSGNRVFVSGGAEAAAVVGGDSEGDNPGGYKVTDNHVEISGGAVGALGVSGGYSKSGDVTKNTVTISKGTLSGSVIGGNSASGVANDNTVEISDGTIKGNVMGGSGSTEASGNTVTITGGTFDTSGGFLGIYGGSGATTTNNNTINILLAKLAVSELCGGDGVTSTGNTLNVAAKGITTGAIYGFQNMNFFIPSEIAPNSDEVMLTDNFKDYITGKGTNLTGVSIGAAVQAGATFAKGDTVNLLTNPNGLVTDETTTMKQITDETVTIQTKPTPKTLTTDQSYTLEVSQKDDTTIIATITDVEEKKRDDPDNPDNPGGSTFEEKTKSLVETRAATTTFVNAGADLLASQGFMQAANAVAIDAAEAVKNGTGAQNVGGFTPFAAFGGSGMRAESGSHVDTKGFGLNIGFARELPNSQGKLLFGPVVEYGGGSYDSHLDDGTKGEGGAHYFGVGLMARQVNHNGFYYEGSVRGGRVTSDYESNDIVNNTKVGYDSSSNYWAAHLGVGKAMNVGGNNTVDAYLKYFYSHQSGDDVAIKFNGNETGDRGNFDSVDSNRIRIGARLTHKINDMNSIYGGLAYQYEFGGEARAHFTGVGETPSPSVKGSSGMLELGWQVKPGGPVTIDLGVTGWAGKQRGGSVQLGATWTF